MDISIPYAVFCEEVQENSDGTITIRRIINSLSCTPKGETVSDNGVRPVLKFRYAIGFRSSKPIGNVRTELRCICPSGDRQTLGSKKIHLKGNHSTTYLSD